MSHQRNPDNPDNATPKDEQRTPLSLYNRLDRRFNFELDAACTPENCLNRNHYGFSKADDALSHDWWGYWMMDNGEYASTFFCNPGYSRGVIDQFVRKSYIESLKGVTVVILLPVDTSTRWWDYCMLASEWIRIRGRVRFNDENGNPSRGSPKFGSMVVVFDAQSRRNYGLAISEMDWK